MADKEEIEETKEEIEEKEETVKGEKEEKEETMDYKCPFCPCVFFSKEDLNRHLRAFGNKPHLRRFYEKHRDLESELFRAHGGADKQIRKIAHIIEDFANYLKSN